MKALAGNKWIWIVGGSVLVVGLLALGLGAIGGSSAAAAEDAGETAVAVVGDLAESATASGRVVAGRDASLTLVASGEVDQVNVAVGDTVNEGDVLVQLEVSALGRAVASAEYDVAIAVAELADLTAEPSAEDVAAAEAAVFYAQAALDSLLAGADEEEVAASEASVRAAEADVASAAATLEAADDVSQADIMAAEANLEDALEQQQTAHGTWVNLARCEANGNGTYACTPVDSEHMETATQDVQAANAQVAIAQAQLDELRDPDPNDIASAQASLAAAVAQYDAAVARHEALLLGASEADIADAETDLASAEATLASLVAGPSDADIAIYETRVAQAETGLQEARNALADATLVAPFDGVITAVHVSEGEHASGVAIEVVDVSSLEVVLYVDEVDLGRLAVGQSAVVTLETWPEVEIEGIITAIAPSATDGGSGVVSYEVHLGLQETDVPVLVDMTANAELVTARREGVLLVPNAAIVADRQAGTYAVNLVSTDADGSPTVAAVQVTVGLRDSQYTQITSGLSEGDEVALGELRAPTEEQSFGDGRPGEEFSR
jgi:HlyD family secretion protein